VFGRGFSLGDLKGPQQKIVDDPVNQAVLFGPGATKKNERTLFTDGNFFTLFNRKTKRFSRVPLGQITGVVTDTCSAVASRWATSRGPSRRSWTTR